MGLLKMIGLGAALTQKWTHGTTEGVMPKGLVKEMGSVQDKVWTDHPDAGLNGMHAWHAWTNAALTHRLGPLGAVFVFLGGIFQESPLNHGSFVAEQLYQGTTNPIHDSGTGIKSNAWGTAMGLLLPKRWAINVSVKPGNQIPGSGNADPEFGERWLVL